MKLDIECVRDVLLYLEDNLDIDGNMNSTDFYTHFKQKKYEFDTLTYTCKKLKEAGFIEMYFYKDNDLANGIHNLTYNGHQFLEKIRPENVWEQTKTKVNQVGSYSFNVISQIASQVLTNIISQQLSGMP